MVKEIAKDAQIQVVLTKLWQIVLQKQYKRHKPQTLNSQINILPVDLSLYQRFMDVVKQVLGVFFVTDKYCAPDPEAKSEFVFFYRFC